MERAERIVLWVTSLAILLAGTTFSYAHLRQIDPWAVDTFTTTVWRLVVERVSAFNYTGAGWMASLAVVLTSLVACVVSLGKGRKPAANEAFRGNGHEYTE